MAPPANELAIDGSSTPTPATNNAAVANGSQHRPTNVGILAMEMYFPKTYVSQAALGKTLFLSFCYANMVCWREFCSPFEVYG